MKYEVLQLNKTLLPYSRIDFTLSNLNPLEISFCGRSSKLETHEIKLTFNSPFLIACPLSFTFCGEKLLEELEGEVACEINAKFHVTTGNKIYRIFTDCESSCSFIIAKSVFLSA